ncbi:hypothetical protein KUTeg_022012 [Tegillarca granosa]|uniref:Uncharacterized protein n=1 Tax=Tegillarca granosa TaxID=220873 RepID=A0ABQ9EB57_TEGGR|nr:hypothetical protein KUTeg_022012 [Tegillarca granosa]
MPLQYKLDFPSTLAILDCTELKTRNHLPSNFNLICKLGKMGIKLNIPPFVSAGSQLSQADVNLTQKIVQHRIHVERAT